jgi:hypothetical protein
MMKITLHCILFYLVLVLNSCLQAPSISLNGASIPPDVKTLTIQNFFSDVAVGPANLPLTFTERLREYYQRNTRLALVPDNGDWLIEGTIIGYDVAPVSPTGTSATSGAGVTGIGTSGNQQFEQLSTQQRLTVTVKVQFTNTKDSSQDFENNFSFFGDFPANKNLADEEGRLLPVIFNQIVLDIFNRTAGNW